MYEGQSHRSKVKVTNLEKLDFFQGFFVISFRFDLEVKGQMGQGQRSRGSRSNEGSKQRQVGSRQRQVASFRILTISSRQWYLVTATYRCSPVSELLNLLRPRTFDLLLRISADSSKMDPTKIKTTVIILFFLLPPDPRHISGTIGPTETVHLLIFVEFNKEYN